MCGGVPSQQKKEEVPTPTRTRRMKTVLARIYMKSFIKLASKVSQAGANLDNRADELD
jgi:hypothetical protein